MIRGHREKMNLDRSFVTFVSIDFDILDDSTGGIFILLTIINFLYLLTGQGRTALKTTNQIFQQIHFKVN